MVSTFNKWCLTCNKLLKYNSLLCNFSRYTVQKNSYSGSFRQEYTVSPYSNVEVNCPFNVRIQPLNVYEQSNQDKVIINLLNTNKTPLPILHCTQTENNIRIFNSDSPEDEHCLCIIDAPIKANIDIKTNSGSVEVGSFENDYLKVTSTSGNITLDTFRSASIVLSSQSGNIQCKKVTQASNIDLKTSSGAITTSRLQGISLNVATDTGNISTESSYCTESAFKCRAGNMRLQNVHKKCKIYIEEVGKLDLVRFDGLLELVMNQGVAEILLSRITDDSVIQIKQDGFLTLKVAEECQNYTAIRMITGDFVTVGDFSVEECQQEGFVLFKPKIEVQNNLLIDCKHSTIKIKTAHFLDMFNLNK